MVVSQHTLTYVITHFFDTTQEYELQRQLMLKLKCLGVNAAFGLRTDVSETRGKVKGKGREGKRREERNEGGG